MHHHHGQCRKEFYQIIPVRNRVHTVQCGPCKTQQLCRILPVQGICGTCKGPCPQGTIIHPFINIPHALSVPPKHFKIRAEMMGQGYGLCLLKMRKSGHEGIQIFFHGVQYDGQKFLQQEICFFHSLPGIHPHIQCNLVIAASPRVQFLAGVTDAADQMHFHKAVDILAGIIYLQPSLIHILPNTVQPSQNPLLLLVREYPLLRQHGNMSHTAPDVLMK